MASHKITLKRNRFLEFDTRRDGNRSYCVSTIRCDECGATAEQKTAASLTDDTYALNFERKGWRADKRHKICPDCNKKPKRPTLSLVKPASQEEPVAALSPKQAAQEIVKAAAAEPPKAMGLDEMLLVLEMVEDNYDPKTGYKGGCSDQQIANSLNCPLDWVRQVRTKKFGNLPETPEITEIRREIEAIGKRITEERSDQRQARDRFNRDIAALGKTFDERQAVTDKILRGLELKLNGLVDRLDKALG